MTKQELLARTKDFSVRVVKMVISQKPDFASRILFAQVLRSGTSVGTNYRAACLAKSTKDFINKLKIVEEELDETVYWMEIIVAAGIIKQQRLDKLMKEGNELFLIVTKAIITTRAKMKDQENKKKVPTKRP